MIEPGLLEQRAHRLRHAHEDEHEAVVPLLRPIPEERAETVGIDRSQSAQVQDQMTDARQFGFANRRVELSRDEGSVGAVEGYAARVAAALDLGAERRAR